MPQDLFCLDHKIALITGASRGIGEAIAKNAGRSRRPGDPGQPEDRRLETRGRGYRQGRWKGIQYSLPYGRDGPDPSFI